MHCANQFPDFDNELWVGEMFPLGKLGGGYIALLSTISAVYCESVIMSKYELKLLKEVGSAPLCRFPVNLTASNTDRSILPDKRYALSVVPVL